LNEVMRILFPVFAILLTASAAAAQPVTLKMIRRRPMWPRRAADAVKRHRDSQQK